MTTPKVNDSTLEYLAELFFDGAGEGSLFFASVLGGGGFDQRDPGLFDGGGVVADAAGDDEELAGAEMDRATVGVGAADAELAAQDEEELVFMGVGVPGELALDTRYLDELIVDLAEDARRPELLELGCGAFEGDGLGLHGASRVSVLAAMEQQIPCGNDSKKSKYACLEGSG